MRVEAEFCISHGDEMKLCSMRIHVPVADLNHPSDVMNWEYEKMAAQLIDDVSKEQADGRISESAHLVTHPSDR